MITTKQIKKTVLAFICLCVFVVIIPGIAVAQPASKVYTVKGGKMYIQLDKKLSDPELDDFISTYRLNDLALKRFIRENFTDSIKKNGWEINKNNKDIIAISKPLISSEDMNNVGKEFLLSISERFPAIRSELLFGYNKFRNNQSFEVKDSMVRFFLRNNPQAKQVMLAGSFNGFLPTALPMIRTDSGWFVHVALTPGKYWYKFVIDGKWYIDEDNHLQENDGEGNTNSVFFKTNTKFNLDGYTKAKKVWIAGSFNGWQEGELRMYRTATGWELPLYLADGTHTYRFNADGNWFADPANPDKMPNEFGEYNSVIKLGYPYLFRLNGFTEARKVILEGTFNGWRKDELYMKKTGSGWELPYTLGLGNYEYKFIVDGNEIADPGNPLFAGAPGKKGNSVLILGANYTFRLKGYATAKTVLLSGDFNGFDEQGYAMKKEGDDWTFTIHLSVGKHLYKFIVDGKWIVDPGNKLWEQNEFKTGNSVIWIEPKDQLQMQQ